MTYKEAIARLRDHFAVHDDGRPTPKLNEAAKLAYATMEKQEEKDSVNIVKLLECNMRVVCSDGKEYVVSFVDFDSECKCTVDINSFIYPNQPIAKSSRIDVHIDCIRYGMKFEYAN